ncbi:hypothetical protein ACFT25_06135 [Streptomyces hydrogenans]|uniref:hypothetical protein n=1 Tax=Streptomyces hydrogenans TaxID=1873719 RepID=UPI003629BCD6
MITGQQTTGRKVGTVHCPPLGAAAIVLQCRQDDTETLTIAARISDPTAQAEVLAERTVLQEMGGFCNAPLAGYARIGDDTRITVQAVAFTRDGSLMIDGRHTGSDAEETAKAVCRHLTRHGARGLSPVT